MKTRNLVCPEGARTTAGDGITGMATPSAKKRTASAQESVQGACVSASPLGVTLSVVTAGTSALGSTDGLKSCWNQAGAFLLLSFATEEVSSTLWDSTKPSLEVNVHSQPHLYCTPRQSAVSLASKLLADNKFRRGDIMTSGINFSTPEQSKRVPALRHSADGMSQDHS